MPKPRRKGPGPGVAKTQKQRPPMSLIRLPGIKLDVAAITAAPANKPSWVQIARTGLWRGYKSGPIEFTRDYFEQLIRNFRANPSFETGPDGYGSADVIPYDFDHGSEETEVDQVDGEPAAAWCCDLEMREGGDGIDELWALTRFLEPARSYCLEGKYHWTSVAIWPNAIDPETAKTIGPLLTSIAFTNKPFISGMQPIQIAASMTYVEKARDPEDAITQLRNLLGLPQTTDVAGVQAELGKLKGWLDAGALPPGVDGDDLIGGMKTILGLPVLASADEVFAELVKLVPALAEHQAQEGAEGSSGGANVPTAAPAATMASQRSNRPDRQQETSMTPQARLTLTRRLGLKDDASDESILLAQEKEAKDGVETKAKLSALLKALGVEDSEGAIGKITDMFAKCKELEAAMPELANLKAEKAKADGEAQVKDVDEAIAAHALPESVRDALILFRKENAKGFAERYPKPRAGEQHLTTQLFTTAGGAPIGSPESGAAPANGSGARVLASNGGRGPRVMLNANVGVDEKALEQAEGRNVTEKAMSLVKMHVPGGDKMSFEQLHEAGSKLIAQLRQST